MGKFNKENYRSATQSLLSGAPDTFKTSKRKEQEPLSVPTFETRGRPRKDDEPSLWAGRESYTTSVVFDRNQYERVVDIAREERVAKKTAMFRLLELGLAEYTKNGHF